MPHLPASLAHADARQEHSPKWLLALAELTEMPEQRWLVDSHMWALSPRSMRHARWRAPARPSLSHGTPECRLNGSTRARQSMRKSVRVTCFLLPARAYCWIGLHSARARSSIRLKFQIARLQLRAQRVTFQLAVRLALARLVCASQPLSLLSGLAQKVVNLQAHLVRPRRLAAWHHHQLNAQHVGGEKAPRPYWSSKLGHASFTAAFFVILNAATVVSMSQRS